ncbi:MAG: hypothetical protein ONB44_19110 [candidate division KSB1 bacterium]|nr:hypothetical protein [candidate division KSB1 bacterium]MDZ7304239.1 hypothetical protein [candidate division KSB1 bacterium]MDZ7311714.1 hypothetical protein [candidate division KSB1 bacterium]
MFGRIVSIIAATFFIAACCKSAFGQDDLRIWKEFVDALRNGRITVDNIRPYEQLGDNFKPILLGFLDSARAQALPTDWDVEPEIIRTDNRIQYLIPLTSRTQKVSYCFSFVTEGSQWYFQHLEAIFIRLDKLSKLPTSEFPDVSEAQKNWAREEIYWSFVIINFYLPTVKEKGKQYALDLLKDGGGYFVGARSWVPFSPPHKAFILYLCWEQANLRGNAVTLVQLEDNEAIVRLNTHFFALYFTVAHLKPRISLDDYKQIFETLWQDRAKNAGWNVEIHYAKDFEVTFHFKR